MHSSKADFDIINKETRGKLGGADIVARAGKGFQGVDPDNPIFPIGTAATMLEVHPRTLRIYENEGLVTPMRKGGRRYYSLNDIQWISCLRHMIHDQGISIAGIKKLLQYTSCWNIVECPMEKRKNCTAYRTPNTGAKG